MNDPIGLRIFENALRESGYYIAARRPMPWYDESEDRHFGTQYVIKQSARGDLSMALVIPEWDEGDEAAGWFYAAKIARAFADYHGMPDNERHRFKPSNDIVRL